MPSPFATKFNDGARVLLWNTHAETVTLRTTADGDVDLEGVWKRVTPEAPDAGDGMGLQAYSGQAMLTVKVATFTDPGPSARIIREGEEWAIRHIEPQDQWTSIIHLARPNGQKRIPR